MIEDTSGVKIFPQSLVDVNCTATLSLIQLFVKYFEIDFFAWCMANVLKKTLYHRMSLVHIPHTQKSQALMSTLDSSIIITELFRVSLVRGYKTVQLIYF